LAGKLKGCILAVVMLRDLERTPVLSQDGVVLSKKVQKDLRRLATRLGPVASTIEARWRRRLNSPPTSIAAPFMISLWIVPFCRKRDSLNGP